MNLNTNIYGVGIIKNTMKPNLDAQPILMGERGCVKDPIYVNDKLKVHPTMGKNYYKDFMNESVNNLNYEEREDYRVDEGINYLESVENQNLDFDGDGQEDFDMGMGVMSNEKAEEVQEEIAKPEALEEKSVKIQEPIKAHIEPVEKLEHIDKKNPLEVNKDEKLNNTSTMKDSQIRSADMLVMASGAVALAMMVLGKATS